MNISHSVFIITVSSINDVLTRSDAQIQRLHSLTLEISDVEITSTVKTVLSNHIKQDIFLAFQTGGCLLLHESSAESSRRSFLHYFHAAISNHLSVKPTIVLVVYGLLTQV